jgi:hypothetical protein
VGCTYKKKTDLIAHRKIILDYQTSNKELGYMKTNWNESLNGTALPNKEFS